MKKLITACFAMILLAGPIAADSYTVTLSSYPVKGSAVSFANGAYTNIRGGCYIQQILLAYSAPLIANTAKDVEVYTTATTPAAAALVLTYSLTTSTGTTVISFDETNPLELRNVAIRKSAVGSIIKATIIYK
jgi:hypothetical protein